VCENVIYVYTNCKERWSGMFVLCLTSYHESGKTR